MNSVLSIGDRGVVRQIHTIIRLTLTAMIAVAILCAFQVRPAAADARVVLDSNSQINVTVADEPDISGLYTVDQNGTISMLYIRQVYVKGLTIEEARDTIAKKLATMYRDPQVVVRMASLGGIGVIVSGAVTSPGERAMRSDSHLNDALQLAGPTEDADLSAVRMTSGMPGEADHITRSIDYAAFLGQQIDADNPPLHDGDVIFVRHRTSPPIQVNVRGEVPHPGRFTMPAKATFVDAIQQAGGLTVDADRAGVTIESYDGTRNNAIDYFAAMRNPDDTMVDPILQPGDTITVRPADRPYQYTVTGGVLRPGAYPYANTPLTLADVLGAAGGPADHAKLKNTTIVRTDASGRIVKLSIDASDPVVQKSTRVLVGDNINIPPGSAPQRLDPLQFVGLGLTSLFGIFR